jgi:hypothetical protein
MSLKYRVRFGSTIEIALLENFERLVKKSKRTKTSLIDEAIFDILVKYKIVEPKQNEEDC